MFGVCWEVVHKYYNRFTKHRSLLRAIPEYSPLWTAHGMWKGTNSLPQTVGHTAKPPAERLCKSLFWYVLPFSSHQSKFKFCERHCYICSSLSDITMGLISRERLSRTCYRRSFPGTLFLTCKPCTHHRAPQAAKSRLSVFRNTS